MSREPQNLSAAAGTQFDINVKLHLLDKKLLIASNENIVKNRFVTLPWPQPEKRNKNLGELFNESLEVQNRIPEIFDIGKKLFEAYTKSKLYLDTAFYDVECRNKFNLAIRVGGNLVSVPIYAILDCAIGTLAANCYPMDLKVSGYSSGASPKPGYWCSYDASGNSTGAYKDGSVTDFSLIDTTWATQGCVYGWSLGKKLFEDFLFEIHGLFIGKEKQDGTRSIKVCGYKGVITSEFQKLVALRFISAWNIVNSVTVNSDTSPNVPWCEEQLLCEMLSRQERWIG